MPENVDRVDMIKRANERLNQYFLMPTK